LTALKGFKIGLEPAAFPQQHLRLDGLWLKKTGPLWIRYFDI